jgi:hypothetical protein
VASCGLYVVTIVKDGADTSFRKTSNHLQDHTASQHITTIDSYYKPHSLSVGYVNSFFNSLYLKVRFSSTFCFYVRERIPNKLHSTDWSRVLHISHTYFSFLSDSKKIDFLISLVRIVVE